MNIRAEECEMTTIPKVAVFVEPTPNPNSLKFIVGREITARGSYEFDSPAKARDSGLATRLFQIPGVEGVFIGTNFVTVRKKTEISWDSVEPAATALIEEEVSSGRPIVAEEVAGEDAGDGDMTDSEAKIRRILDMEIRPAVASDGGDVMFHSFAGGILTLKLVGSCSGCPSSLMTLRMGIERRLKEDVPELTEVVSLA